MQSKEVKKEEHQHTRQILLPGEFIDERKGRRLGFNVYTENEKVFAKVIGIPKIGENEIDVIPLSGGYMPKTEDRVIGIITSVEISGWMVDINSPYTAFLPLSEAVDEFVDTQRTDLTRYFNVNDLVFCRISRVTKNKTIQVSMRDPISRKLSGGVMVKVTPSKIPRIIGKGGSMINLIKNSTKSEIITGQNGRVWIRGENKAKAIEAIVTIQKESHILGLTEKIEKMLS